MNYSIKDIAKKCGVSTATVSRVINNKGKYSKETEAKVLKVINDLGYKVNSNAQTLRTKISKTIGILVPDINNHFFSDIVQKIEKLLFDLEYSTIICNTDRNQVKENNYLNILESKNVDGLIIISGSSNSFSFEGKQKYIPYICIDREPFEFSNTIFISSNHLKGAEDATRFLINKGVKHPLIVLPKKLSISSESRLEGFKNVLKEYSISFSEETNTLVLSYNNDNSDILQKFFNNNHKVDGIFAVNDNLAIEIIKFLKLFNIRVPDDIQIVGFDNIPASKIISPELTTVSQNTNQISEYAVNKIIDLINGKAKTGTTIIVPTKIIERNSTK